MRFFDGFVEETAGSWFKEVALDVKYQIVENLGHVKVVELGEGCRAYLKFPWKGDAGKEKLIADLGYLLGLPVAPVVLLNCDFDETENIPMLSLECIRNGEHWPPDRLVPDELVSIFETLRIFYSWVGDSDHNQHPLNMKYDQLREERLRIVTFDHAAASLGDSNWSQPGAVPGYRTEHHPLASSAKQAAMAAIQGIAEAELRRLVDRLIPLAFDREFAERGYRYLSKRQQNLGEILTTLE